MLIDLLRTAVADTPDRDALVAQDRTLSYRELLAAAERVGRGLVSRGATRVGVAGEDPVSIITAVAGASAAGVEVCVYPRSLGPPEIGAFAERLGHEHVVVDVPVDVAGVATIPLGQLDGDAELPDTPAEGVLILTTGTSGTPKGVRHEWARLIAGVPRADDQEARRWLLAYNLNQFAGFQVLLHVLVHRCTLVVPPTSQARDAMRALRASAVTHVSATPTFYRLLVGGETKESTADLALEQLTMGGEAAPATLIARLRELFPSVRITHIYAGTEFGSAVAVTDGLPGLPISVLERGEDAAVQLRIVDGELEVRSRHGMLGYLGGEAAQPWHATGDLVDVVDDRIQFVGRRTEIINVGGAKVHPLPIEDLVSTVPGVRHAAVYGAPNAITGQIVAIDLVLEDGADEETVVRSIHKTCRAELPAPGRPRRIRVVDRLETLGDKVVRRETENRT